MVYLIPACDRVDHQASGFGMIYMYDIVMINNAYPLPAILPTVNPTPTTACASVSIAAPSPATSSESSSGSGGGDTSGNKGGSSCPACTLPQALQYDMINDGYKMTGVQKVIQSEMDTVQQ